jgi:hypothetical protein
MFQEFIFIESVVYYIVVYLPHAGAVEAIETSKGMQE